MRTGRTRVRTRIGRRRRHLGVAGLVALVIVAGATLGAACGDKPDGATIDGYWDLTTGEELTIRIDAPEGTGRLAGLSARELPVLPGDDDGYTIPNWRWRGVPVVGHLTLSGDGEKLTIEVSAQKGSATASPMLAMTFARATADPDVLQTRVRDQQALFADTAVKEGIHALQVAVQSWLVDHDLKAPPVSAVRPGGALETYVDAWPINPYVDEVMSPGEGPGEYTYERVGSGRGYRLTGHLEDGDVTVP